MTFGIRIGATDETQGSLRSALSGFTSFARTLSRPILIPLKIASGGLSLLRDINLGLRPLVAGIDHIIAKGTALDTVSKSFRSLTGLSDAKAAALARRLVDAAHGGLRLSEAMQLANRAMAAGMDPARDLPTIFDFAAKKAVTTGMEFGSAMERIIMGLSRGSPAILDDFGLLNDGLEGVTKSYEKIKGSGAWEALGPAGQKAEIIRQAMADMQRQLGKIGVTGQETVFVWQRIKNEIGDAVDTLFAAVGRSDKLKSALAGVRDVIAGMTRHIEKGGSLWDILFGKKGGQSGGLFGGLQAGILDLGEQLGRGILGGLLKGVALLPELGDKLWDKMKEAGAEVGQEIYDKLAPLADEIPANLEQAIKDGARPLVDLLRRFFPSSAPVATSQPSDGAKVYVEDLKAGGAVAAKGAPGYITRKTALDLGVMGAVWLAARETAAIAADDAAAASLKHVPMAGDVASAALPKSVAGTIGRQGLGFIAKKLVPAMTIADFLYTGYGFATELGGYIKAAGERADAEEMLEETRRRAKARGLQVGMGGGLLGAALVAAAMGVTPGGSQKARSGSLFDLAGKWGDRILSGWSFGSEQSRTEAWLENYRGEFPAPNSRKPAVDTPTGLRLTQTARLRMLRDRAALDREEMAVRQGLHGTRQDALRRTNEEVRRLKSEGYDVGAPGSRIRRDIYARMLGEVVGERVTPLHERQAGIHDRLSRDDAIGDRSNDGVVAEGVTLVADKIDAFVQGIAAVLAELTGLRGRLQAAGPKRG